jgi:glycosyltransferase involved in cell wall biosynthesis
MTASASDPAQRPLKILMTADAAGGVWQYTVDLAAGLVRHGTEILIATMGPRPSPEQKRQLQTFRGVTIAESDYALEWMPHPWRDVDRAGQWLLDLQSDFRADVIHLNGYCLANLPWLSPVIVVGHSCVYSWWKAVRVGAPGAEWSEYKRRVTSGLRACDLVIAPSNYMAAALQDEYSVDPGKMRVIYNVSSNPTFAGTKESFILAAGRVWDPAKNLDLLTRIAPRLDWEVSLAGDAGGTQEAAADGKPVRRLGFLSHPELMAQMNRAAIFAHPALYEPFGLSVVEAARARCCLVVSDIPSLRELWDGAAVFIDPRNPDAWISEINRLSRDLDLIESLALRAQSHSLKYSATCIDEYFDIYCRLRAGCLQSRKRGAA